jgi:hypothetical protein
MGSACYGQRSRIHLHARTPSMTLSRPSGSYAPGNQRSAVGTRDSLDQPYARNVMTVLTRAPAEQRCGRARRRMGPGFRDVVQPPGPWYYRPSQAPATRSVGDAWRVRLSSSRRQMPEALFYGSFEPRGTHPLRSGGRVRRNLRLSFPIENATHGAKSSTRERDGVVCGSPPRAVRNGRLQGEVAERRR